MKNHGEDELFADFLRTAGDKHGYHQYNMNNHHPKVIDSIGKHLYGNTSS